MISKIKIIHKNLRLYTIFYTNHLLDCYIFKLVGI